MNRFQLLLRNLLHFRGVNLAVVIGMAVATAVLSGAMMVGDSVRGSLRELALQRLGKIDDAVISRSFFDASLASRVAKAAPDFEISPTAIVTGAASDESSGTRTSDVQVAAGAWIEVDPGKCIINGDLADSLGIKSPGESIVLSVPSDSDAPREAALDRRSRSDTISGLRAQVSQIIRDPGVVSMFNPHGSQRSTRNAWVNLADLQDALDQDSRVNALLAHSRSGNSAAAGASSLNNALAQVVTLGDYGLARTPVLSGSEVSIGSRLTYLAPPVVDAANAVAARLGVPLQKIAVNLLISVKATQLAPRANLLHSFPGASGEDRGGGRGRECLWVEMTSLGRGRAPTPALARSTRGGGKFVSFVSPVARTGVSENSGSLSSPAIVDFWLSRAVLRPKGVIGSRTTRLFQHPRGASVTRCFGTASGISRTPATTLLADVAAAQSVIHYAVVAGVNELEGDALGAQAAAINQWTADQLGLKVGDTIAIDFPDRGPSGELREASASHPAPDLTFTVTRILPMAGIGADPSVPPDYKGLTDADSVADWNPPEGLTIDKSLVTKPDEAYWHTYRAAPKIFISFDTAKKLWGGVYGDVTGLRVPAATADAFCDALRSQISPGSMQMIFRPIKAEQLAAASGGTDFSQYFLYFSFFLIVAAVLLVAMLFRLGIEQRARQLGLMAAVGFTPGHIRSLAIWEGFILAIIGGVIGSFAGIGYTWLIMAGLRTWWIGAVGTTALRLYVQPDTLIIGFVAGVIVAILAVWWGAWRIGRTPVAQLLAGGWENETGRARRSGLMLCIVGIVFVVAGLSALTAAAVQRKSADEAFLAGGSLLLCGSLLWLGGSLRPALGSVPCGMGVPPMLAMWIRRNLSK